MEITKINNVPRPSRGRRISIFVGKSETTAVAYIHTVCHYVTMYGARALSEASHRDMCTKIPYEYRYDPGVVFFYYRNTTAIQKTVSGVQFSLLLLATNQQLLNGMCASSPRCSTVALPRSSEISDVVAAIIVVNHVPHAKRKAMDVDPTVAPYFLLLSL